MQYEPPMRDMHCHSLTEHEVPIVGSTNIIVFFDHQRRGFINAIVKRIATDRNHEHCRFSCDCTHSFA